MEGPQGRVVAATRSYKRGNQSLTATIMVGNSTVMAWAPFQTGMTVETPEVLIKTISYKGLKAGINYDKKEKGGGIVIQLSTEILTRHWWSVLRLWTTVRPSKFWIASTSRAWPPPPSKGSFSV